MCGCSQGPSETSLDPVEITTLVGQTIMPTNGDPERRHLVGQGSPILVGAEKDERLLKQTSGMLQQSPSPVLFSGHVGHIPPSHIGDISPSYIGHVCRHDMLHIQLTGKDLHFPLFNHPREINPAFPNSCVTV